MNNNRVFISYRRDGGDITAKLVSEALKNRGYKTFYDYDTLKGGVFLFSQHESFYSQIINNIKMFNLLYLNVFYLLNIKILIF